MQIDLDKKISAAKFAELVGVSRPAVSGMFADGTLERGATGIEWLRSYLESLRLVAAGRADSPSAQASRERILQAEANRREEMALLAKIKRRQQQGELLAADDLTAAVTSICAITKNDLWGWQARLSPQLEHLPKEQIAPVLEREAWQVLDDMAERAGPRIKALAEWLAEHAPREFWQYAKPLQTKADA